MIFKELKLAARVELGWLRTPTHHSAQLSPSPSLWSPPSSSGHLQPNRATFFLFQPHPPPRSGHHILVLGTTFSWFRPPSTPNHGNLFVHDPAIPSSHQLLCDLNNSSMFQPPCLVTQSGWCGHFRCSFKRTLFASWARWRRRGKAWWRRIEIRRGERRMWRKKESVVPHILGQLERSE